MITSMPEFAKRFRDLFPDMGASNRFLDPLLSAASKRPRLDPMALDDALIAKHGDYNTADDTSMQDFVRRTYGEAAVAFISETM